MPFINKIHRDGCCIYRIENVTKGKSYIGQTVALSYRREMHKAKLQKGTHSNKEMQRDFSSGDLFVMTALEYFSRQISSEYLNAKEQAYIIKYKANIEGYNIKPAPKSNVICKPKPERYPISIEKLQQRIAWINKSGGLTYSKLLNICININCQPEDIMQFSTPDHTKTPQD